MPNATQPVSRYLLGSFPGKPTIPVSTSKVNFTTRHQRFSFIRLSRAYLSQYIRDFSSTLTTMALYQRSLRRFETWPCSPIPEDLPPS